MADFFARTEELAALVGEGDLEGIFGVDGGERTVPLEVGGWLDFMGRYGPKEMEHFTTPGTGPHAAQNALEETHGVSLEDIAASTLTEGPEPAMERHVERVDEEFKRRAPRVTGEYADSTRRVVIDDGRPVYEREGEFYGREPNE